MESILEIVHKGERDRGIDFDALTRQHRRQKQSSHYVMVMSAGNRNRNGAEAPSVIGALKKRRQMVPTSEATFSNNEVVGWLEVEVDERSVDMKQRVVERKGGGTYGVQICPDKQILLLVLEMSVW